MQGALTQITSPQNALPSPLNATAYDSFGVVLSPQPHFSWESSNPDAVSVSPTDATGSQCNVTRTVQGPTDLATFDSNGVQSDGSEIGGLTTIECEALRPDSSQSGVIGQIKIAIAGNGYSWLKATTPRKSNTSTPLPIQPPFLFVPPPNLVE
jgi:hypothetical protein